jgi:hypothetical protein
LGCRFRFTKKKQPRSEKKGEPRVTHPRPAQNRGGTLLTSILAAPGSGPKKAFRIPEDFAPSPGSLRWAAQHGYDALDLDYQTERFVNYFLGHNAAWTNWQRAWMNWVLRAAHDNPKVLNARVSTRSGPILTRAEEEEIARGYA